MTDFNFSAMCCELENLRKNLSLLNENGKSFIEKLYESQLLEALISLIIPEFYAHFEILTEVLWFLSNISVYSKPEQTKLLIKLGLFDKCISIINNSKFDILIHDVICLF